MSIEETKENILLQVPVGEALRLLAEVSKELHKYSLLDIIIINNLRNDCETYRKRRSNSYYEDYTEVDIDFINRSLCGCSPMGSQWACEMCKVNFLKIKYHYNKGTLHLLARDWWTHFEDKE